MLIGTDISRFVATFVLKRVPFVAGACCLPASVVIDALFIVRTQNALSKTKVPELEERSGGVSFLDHSCTIPQQKFSQTDHPEM
jgi:hypothetical protein